MQIRTRLLLLGLATLALPWAGCQYAREMESSLRVAESQALLAVASTIATTLQGREDLLLRHASGSDANTPATAPAAATATASATAASTAPAGPYDFVPVPLGADPQLDGRADDWPMAPRAWRQFGQPGIRVLAGSFDRYLYLLVDAPDDELVLDASDAAALDPAAMGDRLWLGLTDPAGESLQVFISGWSTGPLRGRRITSGEFGRPGMTDEPRVTAAWRRHGGTPGTTAATGWSAEIRLPLSMVGDRFGVLLDDRDRRGAAPRSYGSLAPNTLAPAGRLIAAAPQLDAYLGQFRQPGVRISVARADGAVLAETSALPVAGAGTSGGQALLSMLYRRFLERSTLAERRTETERGRIDALQARAAGEGRATTALLSTADERRLVVAAAAPIRASAQGPVLAVLQVAQTADRWLLLRDRALTRLLNLTLLVMALVIGAILLFGARLALRLDRLRRASDAALSRDGQVRSEFPDTAARDELGDVARGFAQLLRRLDDYTRYLRSLAGKLSHEIRTPLTIVRSSLENLESEALPHGAQAYVARAREGSERLNSILQAMGAATRVEESIQGAERVDFDLAALLQGAAGAYRTAFATHRFVVEGAELSCPMRGAPELVMQLLDKLVDNAVDFSPAGSGIVLRLRRSPTHATLDVENDGPPLPADAGQLFESLWQRRRDGGEKPHFGLGLYIVRLIADFHDGSVEAANRPGDPPGVRFSVGLRLMAPDP
jgi:dedicated sortase system histidine kinase